MKQRLIAKYGTLRNTAIQTGINYYRLSQIVNGWRVPSKDEMSMLEITDKEMKKTLKKKK